MALAEVSIAHGGLNVGMAQDLFDTVEVRTRHDPARSGRMAESMLVRTRDAGPTQRRTEDVLQERIWTQWFQRIQHRGEHKGRLSEAIECSQYRLSGLAHWYVTGLTGFRDRNGQHAVFQVDAVRL